VLAGAATELKFKSRFGYATTGQIAHAQVSTDEGRSWDTLFTAAGTGAPASEFSPQTVSLAAYANRTLQVRFIFAYEGESTAFTQTDDGFGWYLDDIAFTGAQELTSPKLSPVGSDTSLNFVPSAAGDYAVQARGQFFGDYLFEWGPVLAVNATANSLPRITTHPGNRTANAGDSVQFSVVATGPGTLSYQWFRGTQPIDGETESSLVLSNLLPSDAGSFHVEVTNSFGTTPSNAGTLTVLIPNPIVTTGDGSALSETAVELSGHVDVTAQTIACGFEFGTTAALGSIATAGSAATTQDFSATVSSVAGNAPIFYRAYAETASGTRFRGAIKKVAPLQPIASLDVVIDPPGGGSVSGVPVGIVRVGDPISLTAQAEAGYAFTGWTGGLTKNSATIAFLMPASLTVTANFSSSPIIQAAGKYRGLALTAPVAHASCGIVNLTIGAKGAFSGQTTFGGMKFALRGVFDAGGIAHFGTTTEATLQRPDQPPLLLRLQLPTGNVSPAHVLGDVRETGGFLATIDAPRVFFTSAKNPVTPLLNPPANWPGIYTGDLAASAAAPIAELAGYGWITATVAKDGSARFVGSLADGTRWTSTQVLIADGTVPIYAALYGGKGSVFGTVQFAGSPVAVAATANWYRPPGLPGTRFPGGWPAGIPFTLEGGAWTPFKANVTWPLPGLETTTGSAHLSANGVGLSPSLDWNVAFTLKTGTAKVIPSAAGATATFVSKAGTGIFTGTFKSSANAKSVSFSGALVPGANRARGYFLTPEGSGAVTLFPQ
ncbi:MAG: immunoglobulin domain-containing protein, partial [Chthoniobacteraceae bacterium]